MNIAVADSPDDQPFASTAKVREWIVSQLRLDLVGPGHEDVKQHREMLSQAPSRWYLTGFLVPLGAPEEQRAGDADAEGDLDSGDDAGGTDDQATPDKGSARRTWRPSSMGLSFLLDANVDNIIVEASWGEYRRLDVTPLDDSNETDNSGRRRDAKGEEQWQREHRSEKAPIDVTKFGLAAIPVPNAPGLILEVLVRRTVVKSDTGAQDAKSVSIFLVNRREPKEDPSVADEAFIFQVRLHVTCQHCFLPRYTMHGLSSSDWDERLGDLHYRDVAEFAVGHNTAAEWIVEGSDCSEIFSCCMPLTSVNRVVPNPSIPDFELGMEALGNLDDSEAAQQRLSGVVGEYQRWIREQREALESLIERRREIADLLLAEAESAATRIKDGIDCLTQPHVLEAFAIANRALARAARQREGQRQHKRPDQVDAPRWRPFQLAFLLLNLRGIVEPEHHDREIVDLLFFPTGGGKTEAYLGLAAFTIAYRRLENPGLTGAGLAVLMRYTLRLLTLDQLARASAVVCALELERQADALTPRRLGDWPIEIGLWVGRAATPNKMGRQGESDPQRVTARTKVHGYKRRSKNPLPVPIRECPWCGRKLEGDSFHLIDDSGRANDAAPTNLKICCVNRDCEFHSGRRALPIVTVDEPIYRRLPAFMIATVDKFAGMPWTGEISGFFGGADRFDQGGFFGPATPNVGTALERPLLPPDLIIQDELHLISGPLGTMVGLYETAIDQLCSRTANGRQVRPKIVVSTATVRRARAQVRALFDRRDTRIFPPPGPNRDNSFFAQSLPLDDSGNRQYLGVAVPGGSPKVLFLRSVVSLMSIAQTAWELAQPHCAAPDVNPAEPYMTVLAYFNALRELGGARRIVEEEVGPRLRTYERRLRVGESSNLKSRDIKYELPELTSRITTEQVAEAKRKLASTFRGRSDSDSVDIALATNMISVGLDIQRLGLMVVSGQPKTTAEYIQATSRVGRDPHKPGLVVVLLNINKPRDRSHYEQFIGFHSMFYRSVEATSVTPFSPRALDRALAAVAVALGRLGIGPFTPNKGARLAQSRRADLNGVADAIAARAASHKELSAQDQAQEAADVRQYASRLLDYWARIATEVPDLGYQRDAGVARHLLYEMLDTEPLPPYWKPFRAPRSLRDVEPSVLVKIRTPDGQALSEDKK